MTTVVATVIAAGALGATSLRARIARGHVETPAPRSTTTTAQRPDSTASRRVVAMSAPPVAIPSVAADAKPATPPLKTILPTGESPLSDGVTALRTDSGVVVSFDSPMVRTRRAAKFESFVRATLPAIYGRGADSALAHVPDGALAGQGDLFSDLPRRGIRIPAGAEWEIRLYPEARTGLDGPLIVRYRVSVVGTTE